MNTKEMIEVMQAFEDGKKIECSIVGEDKWHLLDYAPVWAWDRCIYRIAPKPEPKKEGRWERKKIRIDDGDYVIVWPGEEWVHLSRVNAIPGFGGIDYQSPFDPKVLVRSMVPVMFSRLSDKPFLDGIKICDRPGIPVAAWFWKEGEK